MSIKIGEKIIETDDEGYLINADDWTEKVAEEIAYQQSQRDNVKLTDAHWGLMQYFREYYRENLVHPTMHKLVMTLGKHHGQHYHDHEAYKAYLYELFPQGPVPELCKIAGLPKPTEGFED